MGQHKRINYATSIIFQSYSYYFVDGPAPLVQVTVYKQAREIHPERKELRLSKLSRPDCHRHEEKSIGSRATNHPDEELSVGKHQ